jgi:D-alanyl-D-alanine carboxypeptidase (penicillin-binding protein 5/6)
VPESAEPVLIEKARKNSLSTRVELEESVAAPVDKGQRLGTMTLYAGEQILGRIPLVAAEEIPRLSWWEVTRLVLRRVVCGR